MRRSIRWIIAPLWIAVLTAVIYGGQAPAQTGIIDGIVLLGSSSDPLAEVDVTLLPQGSRGQAGNPATKTGPDGKFRLENIPAGGYQLRIQKLGYFNTVATSTSYLITMPITVAAQQQIKDLEFRLIQGGVIKGHVLDPDGKPLQQVPVSALLSQYTTDGNPRLYALNMNVLSTGGNPTGGAAAPATDDKGEYRLYWLAPGKYYVRADYNPAPAPTRGRPGSVVQQAITTYYPSANDAAQAGALTLSPGGEVTADIIVRQPASVTVSGRLVETGPMAGAARTYNLYLFPRDPRVLSDRTPRQVGTVIAGVPGAPTFSIPFVTPGEYFLVARYLTAGYAQTPIDVKRDNISDVTLNVEPSANMKLRVTVQGDPTALQPSAIAAMGLRPEFFDTPWSTTKIADDGSGEVNSAPGRYVFQSMPLPGDAYIANVQQGARSVMREMITLRPDAEPLQVTVNTAGGRIEGNVRDATGKLVTASVSIVPLNRERIPLYMPILRAPAEASGHFVARNLPPGDYKLFAFENIPAGADANSEFMAKVDALATRVTVTPGSLVTRDLRRISREAANQ